RHFHQGDVLHCIDDDVELPLSCFRMCDLTTSKTACQLDLVSTFKKTTNVLHLEVDVMAVSLRPQLDFLVRRLYLTLFRLVLLLLFFVFVLSMIHDLADGRLSFGIDLHKIEQLLSSEPLRLISRKHP